MKIVCDACQAKYSISDDKVQGKVFKIRCKKCSNIIVVRGGAGAAEPAAAPQQEKDTRVYDYGYEGGDQAPAGDEAVWHVVINQDQVGPMTAQDVQQRFASGEIDAETYIWREGFGDWMPLAQVDTFAGLAASGQTTTATGHGGAAAVSSMFGGGTDEAGTMRSDPGDLFAAASAGRAHQDDDGGDLFGSKPSRGQQSNTAANSKLRGERNENSVLFSLNNLAQLASDKPAPVTAAPSSAGSATGAAGGEGSGLIDIRSMASAYLGSTGAAKPASAGIGSIDDLPVFGGGGFSEPAVIVPMAARASNNKLMYALIGSVGLLAVAAVVVVVVLLRNGDKPAQVASAAGATGSDTSSSTATGSDKPTTPEKQPDQAATGSGSNTQVAALGPGDKQPTTPDKQPTTPDKTLPDKTTPDKHTTAPPPVHKTTTPNPGISGTHNNPPPTHDKTVTPPKDNTTAIKDKGGGGDSGGCDEVSCVLNNYEGACCSKFKKGGGGGGNKQPAGGGGGDKPAVHSDLPDALDRTMISDGVSKVKAKVMSCGDKSPAKGQVKVSVKVSADGHVAAVTVKNTPDPGLGSCVAGAMQHATFSKTQSGGSFSYPFVF